MKKALLILSHHGKSFLGEWFDALQGLDIPTCVISSSLTPDQLPTFLDFQRSQFNSVYVTSSANLNLLEVMRGIETFAAQGYEVFACVSVWESYRQLASEVNAVRGAPDLRASEIEALRDKFRLRRRLVRLGLTKANARILRSSKTLNRALESSQAYFIKPRFGIASFGAFRLQPDTKWTEILKLRQQMKTDEHYSSYFNNLDLILESYISGREFSFEILAGASESVVVAIHEKVEVDEVSKTTLESACVSPPVSLSTKETEKAVKWIQNIFKALDLREGCFHAEARFDGQTWEIIEINPRLGGAFIYHSAQIVSQISLLRESAHLILERDPAQRLEILRRIEASSVLTQMEKPSQQKTFFRVFFADPNKVIEKIRVSNATERPVLSKIFLKDFEKTSDSSREIFLGQALWKLPNFAKLNEFQTLTKNFIEVTYQGETHAKILSHH